MTCVYDENDRLLYIGNPPLCSEKNPIGSSGNYACQDAHSVIRRAVEKAQEGPSGFYQVAWGSINGKLVSPVGVIRFLGDKVWFSFFNAQGLDGKVVREHPRSWQEVVRQQLSLGKQTPQQRQAVSIEFPIYDGDLDELIERMVNRIFR